MALGTQWAESAQLALGRLEKPCGLCTALLWSQSRSQVEGDIHQIHRPPTGFPSCVSNFATFVNVGARLNLIYLTT